MGQMTTCKVFTVHIYNKFIVNDWILGGHNINFCSFSFRYGYDYYICLSCKSTSTSPSRVKLERMMLDQRNFWEEVHATSAKQKTSKYHCTLFEFFISCLKIFAKQFQIGYQNRDMETLNTAVSKLLNRKKNWFINYSHLPLLNIFLWW